MNTVYRCLVNGFTLIELLMVIFIISILFQLSSHYFFLLSSQSKMNQLRDNLTFFIRRGLTDSAYLRKKIILVPLISNEEMDTQSKQNNNWNKGWSLVVASNTRTLKDINHRDVISIVSNQHMENINITFKGSLNRNYLMFNASGQVWPIGHFVFCHKKIPYTIISTISSTGQQTFKQLQQPCAR